MADYRDPHTPNSVHDTDPAVGKPVVGSVPTRDDTIDRTTMRESDPARYKRDHKGGWGRIALIAAAVILGLALLSALFTGAETDDADLATTTTPVIVDETAPATDVATTPVIVDEAAPTTDVATTPVIVDDATRDVANTSSPLIADDVDATATVPATDEAVDATIVPLDN